MRCTPYCHIGGGGPLAPDLAGSKAAVAYCAYLSTHPLVRAYLCLPVPTYTTSVLPSCPGTLPCSVGTLVAAIMLDHARARQRQTALELPTAPDCALVDSAYH